MTCRGHSAVWLCANRLKVAARSDNRGPFGERKGHFGMKEGDQTFAFGQQAASVHDARDDAALHRLDQGPVILPHPVVELDQLPSTHASSTSGAKK